MQFALIFIVKCSDVYVLYAYVANCMALSKQILIVTRWWPIRLVELQTPWGYYTCAVVRSTVMIALLGLWMSLSAIFPRQGLWESSCTSCELSNWARDEPEAWQQQGEPQTGDNGTSFITTGDFVLISPTNKQTEWPCQVTHSSKKKKSSNLISYNSPYWSFAI